MTFSHSISRSGGRLLAIEEGDGFVKLGERIAVESGFGGLLVAVVEIGHEANLQQRTHVSVDSKQVSRTEPGKTKRAMLKKGAA